MLLRSVTGLRGRAMTLVIGLLMAAQAVTGTAPAPAGSVARKPQPNKLICVETQQLGSRLGGHRVCRTKAEWDQDAQNVRADTEKAQITNYHE